MCLPKLEFAAQATLMHSALSFLFFSFFNIVSTSITTAPSDNPTSIAFASKIDFSSQSCQLLTDHSSIDPLISILDGTAQAFAAQAPTAQTHRVPPLTRLIQLSTNTNPTNTSFCSSRVSRSPSTLHHHHSTRCSPRPRHAERPKHT